MERIGPKVDVIMFLFTQLQIEHFEKLFCKTIM